MWKGNVVRIYTGADNRSHFEDLSVPLEEVLMDGRKADRSETIPVKGLIFRENPLGPQGEYHTPKQRQFVITISGAVEITCGGGSRVFGPGDVLFAEDLKGEGHSNRELHGPRKSLIVPVPEDFDVHRWTKRG